MKYCTQCGFEMLEDAAFCAKCGAPAAAEAVEPEIASAPINADLQEEQEFLDFTHRLLRWERKAWSITGKAYTIIGIALAATLFICGLAISMIDEVMAFAGGAYILMALIYGGLFIGIGIVSRIAADKTVQYLDSMYADFKLTLDRCGSIGMLIFSIFFGAVSVIFFLINFVRIKTNRRVIDRILARQNPNA